MLLGDDMDVWFIWIIIIILLLIIEYYTADFTTVWFVASSLVVLLLTTFMTSFWWQIAVFLGLGLILLIITRPILLRKIHQKRMGSKEILGAQGRVIKKITANRMGEVKINNQIWFAVADEELHLDDKIKVEKTLEQALQVKKIKNN